MKMYSGIVLVFLVVYEVLFLSSAEFCPKDFQCGDFGNLSFPFTDYAQPHCGLFITNCSDQSSPMVSLSRKSEPRYKLLAPPPNSHENSISVLDTQLQDSLNQQACSLSFEDAVDAANSDAVSFTVVPNITVIRCNNETTDKMMGIEPFMGLRKYNTCHDFTIYYKNPKEDINHPNPLYYIGTLPPNCYTITLPMAPLDSIDENSGLFDLLTAKFDLTWNLSDNCVDCLNGNRSQCDIGDNYICATAGKPHVHKEISTWMGILGLIAILLVSALPTFLGYKWIRRRILKAREKRRRDDYLHRLRGSDSFNYGDELEKGIKEAPDVKIFSLKAILTATDNFSNENKLGQGGYGPVYKGKLFDGREIAVKKLSKTSRQGFEEFRSELILISKLQHTNLVRLYGCCIHHEEKMLIYEFMPNKSLDFFLFAEDKKEKLDWQIRYNIIEGVAQGLLYLHKYSRMKVIHRDLKVSNVLLDENMNPKIADFGMARIVKQDTTEAVTNRVVGTYGYMAPEYAMEGTFSVKSDVFSFGVLLLEIVSGKRNSSFYNPDRPLNLVGYAWELWKGHASIELKDKALGESFDVKQLLRAIHIGLICVQENADDRPSMSDVIHLLNNETINLPSPKQPAFFTGRQTDGFRLLEARSTDYLLERPNHVSENGLTLTTMEAR